MRSPWLWKLLERTTRPLAAFTFPPCRCGIAQWGFPHRPSPPRRCIFRSGLGFFIALVSLEAPAITAVGICSRTAGQA